MPSHKSVPLTLVLSPLPNGILCHVTANSKRIAEDTDNGDNERTHGAEGEVDRMNFSSTTHNIVNRNKTIEQCQNLLLGCWIEFCNQYVAMRRMCDAKDVEVRTGYISIEYRACRCFQMVQHLRGRKNWLDQAAFVCAARGSFYSPSAGVLDNFAMRTESLWIEYCYLALKAAFYRHHLLFGPFSLCWVRLGTLA